MTTLVNYRNRIVCRLFQSSVVTNYDRYCQHQTGRALLYYITAPFTPGYSPDWTHTNAWEAREIARILNELGYVVDVIDRSVDRSFVPDDAYDIFIGNGSSDSGRHYARLAAATPSATHILYALTAHPDIQNKKLRSRYKQLEQRSGKTFPPYRLNREIDFSNSMKQTEYIFSIGGAYANSTYAQYTQPRYQVQLSTASRLDSPPLSVDSKRRDHFLFFAGHGNVLKGLDLVLEAFSDLPRAHLYVCTWIEPDIGTYYRQLIRDAKNIHVVGPVGVNGKKFQSLTRRCGYVILPSCSEGKPTSVLTCMRQGLVPVVTPETGIEVGEYGIPISEGTVASVRASVQHALDVPTEQFQQSIYASYQASTPYTRSSFRQSMTHAFVDVLRREGKSFTMPAASAATADVEQH